MVSKVLRRITETNLFHAHLKYGRNILASKLAVYYQLSIKHIHNYNGEFSLRNTP